MVRREDFYYDSRDNVSKIHAIKWVPENKPICVLQIIHGMAEHIACYDHFAAFLAQKGILVVGNDHLGHGESIGDNGVKGYFCRHEAATVVVRDVHRLKKMIQERNAGVPYFILGHSMGSFILRNYLLRYGSGINGAIIVGTGTQKSGMLTFGKALTTVLAAFQGWKHPSALMQKVAFGGYNSRILDKATSVDWICRDTERVQTYIKDVKCGFTFTLNGFHTLFTLIERVTGVWKLTSMPKNLPVLLTAGTMDPVGNYGEAVKVIYEEYKTIGMNRVSLKLYDGCRHEIINETNKAEVYEDLYQWIFAETERL